MECITNNRDRAEVLIEYCSGMLDELRVREIDAHIAGCAQCRAIVGAQSELWKTLDGFAAPEVSSNFDAKLFARITEENAAPAWKRWGKRIFEPAVPVAIWKPAVSFAVACAVIAVGLVMRTPAVPESSHPQVRVEHSVDIEQVADALDDLELLIPSAAM